MHTCTVGYAAYDLLFSNCAIHCRRNDAASIIVTYVRQTNAASDRHFADRLYTAVKVQAAPPPKKKVSLDKSYDELSMNLEFFWA